MGVIQHAINAAIHLLGTAGEINMHRVTLDGDGAGDARNRLIKAIGFQGRMPSAIGECRDGAAHGGIRALMQSGAEPLQIRQACIAQKFIHAARANFIGNHLRFQIAHHLARQTHIGEQDFRQILIPFAGAKQAGWRDANAFFKQLSAIGGPKCTADIRRMGNGTSEAHQLSLVENRADGGEIRQMPGGEPWIIGHHAITRLPGLGREAFQKCFGGFR